MKKNRCKETKIIHLTIKQIEFRSLPVPNRCPPLVLSSTTFSSKFSITFEQRQAESRKNCRLLRTLSRYVRIGFHFKPRNPDIMRPFFPFQKLNQSHQNHISDHEICWVKKRSASFLFSDQINASLHPITG